MEQVKKPLEVIFGRQKSFYKKAHVIETFDGTTRVRKLLSYSTIVAAISHEYATGEEKCTVYGTYSNTTLRHIKEFLLQNGFEVYPSSKLLEVYHE